MPLKTHIKNLIAQTGPISMSEFMRIALADAQHGYYKTREPFGTKGDFITAPEISQMFGELIGIWCADIWQKMGSPNIEIVEIGPGRGTLMADLLRGTRKIQGFHDNIAISMVETSKRLQEIQREKLVNLHPRIKWFEDIATVPDKPLIIVTNELFDALPINQYVMQNGKWHEKMLGLDGSGELAFMLRPVSLSLEGEGGFIQFLLQKLVRNPGEGGIYLNKEAPPHPNPLPQGEGTTPHIEICPEAIIIMEEISKRIKQHGGAALIIDYGYTKPEYNNTISAITSHKHHDMLENIGNADISAHVDFALLAKVAINKGMKIFGATGQGDFLRNLGIDFRAIQLTKNATEKQKQDIETAKTRLTGNGEAQMGELFKVLAVTNGVVPEGF